MITMFSVLDSKVPSYLNVVDIAGLVKGAHEGQGLGNAFLSHIRACDAVFHMMRELPLLMSLTTDNKVDFVGIKCPGVHQICIWLDFRLSGRF